MIGFRFLNLLLPSNPGTFDVRMPSGVWTFTKDDQFTANLAAIQKGQVAETYSAKTDLPSITGSRRMDVGFDEALEICLAATIVTGASVTVSRSLPGSELLVVQTGPHFPRVRATGGNFPCVTTLPQAIDFVEKFVTQWPTVSGPEKLLLLSHHFLDSISSWSLEGYYLSGSTLLQIIAETEEQLGRQFAQQHSIARGNKSPSFMDFLAGAADRAGIPALAHDVVKIRNQLVHQGSLKGTLFPDQEAAAKPIADAMNWFDSYVYAILGLGAVPKPRHSPFAFSSQMNSFSF